MSTKCTRTFGALLFGVISLIAWGSPALADIAVIGKKGEVLLFSTSGETVTLTTLVERLSHRRSITESYFASSEKKLFVSDDTGKLCSLDFSGCSNGYQRIDTGKDLVSCAVWYDARAKCAASTCVAGMTGGFVKIGFGV